MKSRVSITKSERVVKNISNLFVKVPTLIYTIFIANIEKKNTILGGNFFAGIFRA